MFDNQGTREETEQQVKKWLEEQTGKEVNIFNGVKCFENFRKTVKSLCFIKEWQRFN